MNVEARYKNLRFTKAQIIAILNKSHAGIKVEDFQFAQWSNLL